jgi:hypothetical protein
MGGGPSIAPSKFSERPTLETKLFDLFNFIGKQELEIEKQRQNVAVHPNFETYSCFKRVARAGGPNKPLPQVVTPDVPVSDNITANDIF